MNNFLKKWFFFCRWKSFSPLLQFKHILRHHYRFGTTVFERAHFYLKKNWGLVRNLEVSLRIFSLFITCPGLGCMPGGKGCLNWTCCWGIPGVPWGGGCWDPGPPSNPNNKTKINQMISEQKINQMISEAFPISKVYETEVRKTERMQSETILALEKGPRPYLVICC